MTSLDFSVVALKKNKIKKPCVPFIAMFPILLSFGPVTLAFLSFQYVYQFTFLKFLTFHTKPNFTPAHLRKVFVLVLADPSQILPAMYSFLTS